MNHSAKKILSFCLGFSILILCNPIAHAAPRPASSDFDTVTTELKSTDPADIDAGVRQIKDWIKGGLTSQTIWRTWIPQLVKDNREQDVADVGKN